MGGGDLNLKKSWAVNIMANQRRTYDAEQKALAERKRAAEVLKEREEERAVEELRRLQMEATGKTSLIDPKVQWMYQDSKNGIESEASEAYLLGKRRVDQIILKQDSQQEDPKKTQDPLAGALTAKDISSKAALDPLLAIEKQRTANLQSLMADPIARRRLMKDMARKDKDEEKKERRHRRHRDDSRDRRRRDDSHDRRHRDDSRERSHRSKRRRYSDESDDDRRERRRHRDRSASPRDRHERRRHRDDSEDARRERRRRRDSDDYDRRDCKRHDEDDRRDSGRSRDESSERHEKRPNGTGNADAEARAAKLAAMSANANELEDARDRRLAEMEARDAYSKEKENQRRNKHGDRFVDNLREQAETKGLGDRLHRASGGTSKLEAI